MKYIKLFEQYNLIIEKNETKSNYKSLIYNIRKKSQL